MIKNAASLLILIFFALPAFTTKFTAGSRVVTNGQTKDAVFYFAPVKWRLNENAPEGERATIFLKESRGAG